MIKRGISRSKWRPRFRVVLLEIRGYASVMLGEQSALTLFEGRRTFLRS